MQLQLLALACCSAQLELLEARLAQSCFQILFFAITTAPMIATSSSNEAISKVNM